MPETGRSTSPEDVTARLRHALAPAFELDAEVGRGGMAIVYRAHDTRLMRPVAVKVLPPDLAFRSDIRPRFLREAQTAARLSHPNIVPIYSVDEREGLVYFVMGFVRGESLGARIRRQGPMSDGESRRVIREVADALAFAHRNGVIHRDIKPDNVLLDSETGRAMVTDFGIARALSDDDGSSRLTATGAAMGTPTYMSPEQCAGDREVDGRSDLYSLGVVAYHMLAGEPPFSGGNTPSILLRQVTEIPAPVRQRRPGVADDLDRIVMRLLEKDPARRFADGNALVAALDGAPLTPQPAPSRAPVRAEDDRNLSRREKKELKRKGQDQIRPLPERLRAFRRHFSSYAATSLLLFGINAVTSSGFWWCVFPIMGMGLGVAKTMGALWADGVPFRLMFQGTAPPELIAAVDGIAPTTEPSRAVASAARGAADEVADGPRGAILKQASANRQSIHDLLERLSETERKLLPDVAGPATALYQRVVNLGAELHRLDGEVGVDRRPEIDRRIAQMELESGGGADSERRVALLRRQRDALDELVRSRATLVEQYESASLLLENIRLDLLKVRSSGLDSALGDITNVTQEARALSREIGYVLEAAREVKTSTGSAAN